MSRGDCERFLAQRGPWRDGRLVDADRQDVARHLAGCPACRRAFGRTRALAGAARGLPRLASGPGLTERVVASVEQRSHAAAARGSAQWQRVLRVAAAVLLLGMTIGAYLLGRAHERRASEDAYVSRDALLAGLKRLGERAIPGPVDEPGMIENDFDRALFVRASRSVLGDLSGLERIEPELGRPLIAAQLAWFGLPDRARRWQALPAAERLPEHRVLDAVAALLARIESAVRGDAELATLREPARELLPRLPRAVHAVRRAPERDPGRLKHVLARCAAGLAPERRSALLETLALKDSWVAGRPEFAVEYAHQRALEGSSSGLDARPLEPVIRQVLRATLEEAGMSGLLDSLLRETRAASGRSDVILQEGGDGTFRWKLIIRTSR